MVRHAARLLNVGLLRGPARWAMTQDWFKNWMHNLGIRTLGHSTLLWFREDEACHTRATMRNYFSLSYEISNPTYSLALYDPDGNRLAEWKRGVKPDETLIVESRELIDRLGIGRPFEGTLAVEVQDPKLDPPRYLRANVDYYGQDGLITTVHDQGRLIRLTRNDVQSMVYVREDNDFETGVVLQNWYRYRCRPTEYMAEPRVELLNSRGERRMAEVPKIPACGMRFVPLKELFPNASAFLGGEAGGLRIHSNIPMGRSISVMRSKKTAFFSVNHTTGDNDPAIYIRELLDARSSPTDVWAPVWSSFVEESDSTHTEFSFFNNWLPRGSYLIDIRLFNQDGKMMSFIPGVLTLHPDETRVLPMAKILSMERVALPFRGSIEARIVPKNEQEQLPGPGMLQVVTLWSTEASITQSNNQSLWYANSARATPHFLSPGRTKIFGRIVANREYETFLSLIYLCSEEAYGSVSDTEVIVTDVSGARRQFRRISVPQHGSIWVNLEDLFPNLRDFLSESNGISSVLIVDPRVKLIGYLGIRHKSYGTVGIDHLFGG